MVPLGPDNGEAVECLDLPARVLPPSGVFKLRVACSDVLHQGGIKRFALIAQLGFEGALEESVDGEDARFVRGV